MKTSDKLQLTTSVTDTLLTMGLYNFSMGGPSVSDTKNNTTTVVESLFTTKNQRFKFKTADKINKRQK